MKTITLSGLLFLAGCAMTPQQAEQMSQMGAAMMGGGYGTYPQSTYRAPAIYRGEQVSGFNKMCFYDRVGSMESYNIPNTGMCPLQLP